jgi:hypothetical protein
MAVDPARCPLCSGPNGCVYASEAAAHGGRCWCEDVSIAPDVLASIPIEQVGRACVCPSCVGGPAPGA